MGYSYIRNSKISTKTLFIKLTLLVLLLIGCVSYVLWIFYNSEPTYTNNNTKRLAMYDIITIDEYSYMYGGKYDDTRDAQLAMVLQTDTSLALVKVLSNSPFPRDGYVTYAHHNKPVRVIGQGTFYHKINAFIGFNLFNITIFIVSILCIVIGVVIFGLISDLFKELDKI